MAQRRDSKGRFAGSGGTSSAGKKARTLGEIYSKPKPKRVSAAENRAGRKQSQANLTQARVAGLKDAVKRRA